MKGRNFVTLLLVAMVLWSPFWVYASALVVVCMFFPFYFEAIILGFLIDVLYRSHEVSGITFFPHALGFTLFIILLIPLKERLRFNV